MGLLQMRPTGCQGTYDVLAVVVGDNGPVQALRDAWEAEICWHDVAGDYLQVITIVISFAHVILSN